MGHGIRTQLDEIKRKEVDRLRQIVRLQNKIRRGMNDDGGVDSQGIVCLHASFICLVFFCKNK